MEWNEKKVLAGIRDAATDDLMDRITVYRAGMESQAIELIENELHRRGVKPAQIETYREECLKECLFHADGTAKVCSMCRKPAVVEKWAWHKLLNKIPLMPRWMRYCKAHAPS